MLQAEVLQYFFINNLKNLTNVVIEEKAFTIALMGVLLHILSKILPPASPHNQVIQNGNCF
jgi:hypothetical protein